MPPEPEDQADDDLEEEDEDEGDESGEGDKPKRRPGIPRRRLNSEIEKRRQAEERVAQLEEEQRQAAERAAQQEGKWQELAENRKVELERLKAQLREVETERDELRELIDGEVESAFEALPAGIRKLFPEDVTISTARKLKWAKDAAAEFAEQGKQRKAPVPDQDEDEGDEDEEKPPPPVRKPTADKKAGTPTPLRPRGESGKAKEDADARQRAAADYRGRL